MTMKIINLDNDNSKQIDEVAICLGNFDGLHLAHQELIKETVNYAKSHGLKSSILLFENHTKEIIGSKNPKLLMDYETKIEILESMGLDIVYKIKFSKDIMKLYPKDFVSQILLEKINSKILIVGFDYKFGYMAMGDINLLKEISKEVNLDLKVINPIIYNDNQDEILISSTVIRDLLISGEIDLANKLIGRKFSLRGKVVHGNKRGRVMGFPTANIEVEDKYLIPKEGIYATSVIINNKKYLGATNVGKNLTFNGENIKIETFIIDFEGCIYDETIILEFTKYIRPEIKFDSMEKLMLQIDKDVQIIKSI